LVVALREGELARLDELERRGRANGLGGLERLDGRSIREREPHAAGLAGLWVPETGIVDFAAVARSFAADVAGAGGEVRTGAEVRVVARRDGAIEVLTATERLATPFLVGCAGLASDRLARLAGLDPGVRIVPFRGDYLELAPEARRLVRGLIYPVPDPELPFLGVHLTRRVDGGVEAGPNAVLAWRRDGYRPGAFALRDALDTLAFPGFWRMARRQAAVARREYRRAWSRRQFVEALRALVPELGERDLRPGGSGVRAQAVDREGRLVDDFVFAEGERMLHVLNAPSPAATASMAIGRILAERTRAALERAGRGGG
jgi:L-2-hydroxyglutarate oxidase